MLSVSIPESLDPPDILFFDLTKPIVLVVDDQKLIVDTVVEILAMYDFRAVPAYGVGRRWNSLQKFSPTIFLHMFSCRNEADRTSQERPMT